MGLFLSEVKGKEQRTLRCQCGDPNFHELEPIAPFLKRIDQLRSAA